MTDQELTLEFVESRPANSEKGYVPSLLFHMKNTITGEIMGHIDLRIGENENTFYGGNVGYEVKEAFRGKRYAARSLKLLLPIAKENGVWPLWATCNPSNTASIKSLEYAGAIQVEKVVLPPHNEEYKLGEREKFRYKFES